MSSTLMHAPVVIGCMKSLLMIFNIAFWLSGLIILCCGIWIQVELHSYLELSDNFSHLVPYVLVSLGIFVLLIAVLACCCTVHGQPALLYLYGGFLLAVFLLEVVLTTSIYAYRDRLTVGFEHGLNRTLHHYDLDVVRTADFDKMQAKLECCGSRGYRDWDALNPPLPVPRSCCVQLAGCDVENPEDIYTIGCYNKVVDYIESNMSWIGAAALIATIFPIGGFLLSFRLAQIVNTAKYEQMN